MKMISSTSITSTNGVTLIFAHHRTGRPAAAPAYATSALKLGAHQVTFSSS